MAGQYKWSREETYTLIVHIERNRCLWGPTDPNRIKKHAVHDAHQKIANEMSIDIESVKKKVSGLRAQMSGKFGKEGNFI